MTTPAAPRTRRWREFEALAARVLSELMPYAEVTHDERIVGKDSGAHRQIDVTARWTDGASSYLLIVQAKDWARPVDIGHVDAFVGVISDVKASRGVMVCSGGFTRQAREYARNLGISLYDLHDANSVNWSHQLTVPFLWVELTPRVHPQFSVDLEAGDALEWHPKYGVPLSYDGGRTVVNYLGTFERVWNAGQISRDVEVVHEFPAAPMVSLRARVEDAQGEEQWRPASGFRLLYAATRRAWLAQYRPADCRGLIDYLDERSFTPTFMDITNLPARRDESWEEVDDPDRVAVGTRGVILISEGFQLDVDGAQFGGMRATLQADSDHKGAAATAGQVSEAGGTTPTP